MERARERKERDLAGLGSARRPPARRSSTAPPTLPRPAAARHLLRPIRSPRKQATEISLIECDRLHRARAVGLRHPTEENRRWRSFRGGPCVKASRRGQWCTRCLRRRMHSCRFFDCSRNDGVDDLKDALNLGPESDWVGRIWMIAR